MLHRTRRAFFILNSGICLGKLDPSYVYSSLKEKGIDTYFGVPNAALHPLVDYLHQTHSLHRDRRHQHLITNDGATAMAMAFGNGIVAGEEKRNIPCVYMDSAEIGSVIKSLHYLYHPRLYQQPCLILMGWRYPPVSREEAAAGEDPIRRANIPHQISSRITEHVLTALELPYSILSGDSDDMNFYWDVILDKAFYHFGATSSPFVVLVEDGVLADCKVSKETTDNMNNHHNQDITSLLSLTSSAVLEQVVKQLDKRDILLCSSGPLYQQLFNLRERLSEDEVDEARPDPLLVQRIHQKDFPVESGLVSAVAAGIAVSHPSRQVIVIEDDASFLKSMNSNVLHGSLASLRELKTGKGLGINFKHIVLNSGVFPPSSDHYTSAPSPPIPTCAFDVSPAALAKACGYYTVTEEPVLELSSLVPPLVSLREADGPAFLEVLVKQDSAHLQRGNVDLLSFAQQRSAFAKFIAKK